MRQRNCVRCNRTRGQERKLLLRYGISAKQYDLLLLTQGGACAICRRECGSGRQLAVDHEHETEEIRGLLCKNCNTGLGLLRDSPALLRAAASYIEQHKQAGSREQRK